MSHMDRIHFEREAGKAVGRTITDLVETPDYGGGAQYGLRLDDSAILWIAQDAEGNGPGWIDYEPVEP